MDRSKTMHIPCPFAAETGAKSRDSHRQGRGRSQPFRVPLRPFVDVHERFGFLFDTLSDRTGPRPRHTRCADEQELLETRAPVREFEDPPSAVNVYIAQIAQWRAKSCVRRRMNDDVYLRPEATAVASAEAEIVSADICRDWVQALDHTDSMAGVASRQLTDRNAQILYAATPPRARAKQRDDPLVVLVSKQLGKQMGSERAACPCDEDGATHVSALAAARTSSSRIRT
jgi:hypothetical protein